MLRGRIKLASEIGPPEIFLPVKRATGDLECCKTEIAQTKRDGRSIEGGVNGIAGARMVEGKVEQCLGGQTGAGPSQPDARRREVSQFAQRTARTYRWF